MVVMELSARLMEFIKEEFTPEDADDVLTTVASVALHDVNESKRYKFLAEYEKIREGVDKRVPRETDEDGE